MLFLLFLIYVLLRFGHGELLKADFVVLRLPHKGVISLDWSRFLKTQSLARGPQGSAQPNVKLGTEDILAQVGLQDLGAYPPSKLGSKEILSEQYQSLCSTVTSL
ncbi:hypothetical protein NE237_006906 [Protea cynaroides]|uniref:Uncharacterized protein n=1 Tax=Protea cynaroides TaxID=273540 RepID=A0A9Q0KN84_9MAGN|nr:hypothetical protein NE237_006906 [Protea cynaroides]